MKKQPKVGDVVDWKTPQGTTTGVVKRKLTKTSSVKGHVAKASPAHPEFEVESSKSGKRAIHAASALKRHD